MKKIDLKLTEHLDNEVFYQINSKTGYCKLLLNHWELHVPTTIKLDVIDPDNDTAITMKGVKGINGEYSTGSKLKLAVLCGIYAGQLEQGWQYPKCIVKFWNEHVVQILFLDKRQTFKEVLATI